MNFKCMDARRIAGAGSALALILALAYPLQPAMAQEDNSFSVTLRFSNAAKRKLSAMGELVTVSAMYGGEPKRGAKEAGEDGTLGLGSEDKTVTPEEQRLVFRGVYDRKLARRALKGAPQLLINVYSARRKHQDNLLDCGIWDGPLRNAAAARIAITCKLIYADSTGAK
ncbi:MAG: hypothetical protein AB7F96_15200 [Beijerinckiaceae bacterium]